MSMGAGRLMAESKPEMETNLREEAIRLFTETLKEISVDKVVRENIQLSDTTVRIGSSEFDLTAFDNLLMVAIGKASIPMAEVALQVLGQRITAGLVASNELATSGLLAFPSVRAFQGGHPLPNSDSRDSANAAINLLRKYDSNRTLILFLISGGGSALFETPIDESISLDDLREVNRVLVGCGAVIGEMNIVRRFLSKVKGGKLAAAAPNSHQVSLYISDVNSDDLSSISSGPSCAGKATRKDFLEIVDRFRLKERFPSSVVSLIQDESGLPEMPAGVAMSSHYLLMDNRVALARAASLIPEGCVAEIAEELVEGDVEEMARVHLQRLRFLAESNPGKLVCLLSGGEVICPVRGDGLGGRNQEFVLRAAINAEGWKAFAILSAGTDGIDGVSPAAGAVADGSTVERGTELGLDAGDYLARSDSYSYFAKLGDSVITGPTGNNVRDLRILLMQG